MFLFHHVTVDKIHKVKDSRCFIASSYRYKIILNLKLFHHFVRYLRLFFPAVLIRRAAAGLAFYIFLSNCTISFHSFLLMNRRFFPISCNLPIKFSIHFFFSCDHFWEKHLSCPFIRRFSRSREKRLFALSRTSVHASLRMYQRGTHWADFRKI